MMTQGNSGSGVKATGGRSVDSRVSPPALNSHRPLPAHRLLWACALFFAAGWGGAAFAQGPPQGGQPPTSAREAAQADLTGYWVSLMTEDWLWRAITPPRGDWTSVPLNPRGREVANEWDLARDEASGEQCRPFGAAGVMRMPTRIHVTWADDETLQIETDAGQQTRLFHFDKTTQPGPEPTWQGDSVAEWTQPVGQFDLRVVFGLDQDDGGQRAGPPKASMKVMTHNLRPGYLRKNGLPYSEDVALTEYYARHSTFGNDYMAILTIVDDPTYLAAPFVTSTHFKREADGANWNPSPCRTDPPRAAAGD